MKKWVLICLLVLAGGITFANEEKPGFDRLRLNPKFSYDTFDWTELPAGITQDMVEALLAHPITELGVPITVLPLGDAIYAMIPCKLDVLTWDQGKWKNLYQGYAAGFNCQSYYFVYDGKLYMYGKYGFWHANSELAVFDFKKAEWDNQRADNIPFNYAGVATFHIQDRFVTLMGQHINQSSGLDQFEKDGFYFDYKKEAWFPLEVDIIDQPLYSNWMATTYDLSDFGLHFYKYQAEIGILALSKSDLSFYFKKFDFTPMRDHFLSVIHGNEIWFYNEKAGRIYLNFDMGLDATYQNIGQITLQSEWLEENTSNSGWKDFLLGLLSLGFLGALLGFFYQKNKAKTREIALENSETLEDNPETQNAELDQIIARLLPYANQSLEVEKFDEIVGIQGIDNLDYRKVRRSRLVKAINDAYINENNRPLLERKRSLLDRRMVLYRVLG